MSLGRIFGQQNGSDIYGSYISKNSGFEQKPAASVNSGFERKATASVLNDWQAQGHEIYTIGDGAHSTYVAMNGGKIVSAAATIDKNKDQAVVMSGEQLTAKMQSLNLPTDMDYMMTPNAVKAIQDIALAESRVKPEGETYLDMRSSRPSGPGMGQ